MLSHQVHQFTALTYSYRTSAGTSGTLPSRMTMFVLCPPFRESEGATKEGEVVLFLDVYPFLCKNQLNGGASFEQYLLTSRRREGDQARVEQILTASMEKIPKWAKFNVWASFDGSTFAPIFESGAVAATEENFQQAVSKIKSYVPFIGGMSPPFLSTHIFSVCLLRVSSFFSTEDETLLSSVQSILSGPSSASVRTLYFVTSMVLALPPLSYQLILCSHLFNFY